MNAVVALMMAEVGSERESEASFFGFTPDKRPKPLPLGSQSPARPSPASVSATLRVISSGPHHGADSEGSLPSRHAGDWGLLG